MYTATLKAKTINKTKRRMVADVTVTDGKTTWDKQFEFGLNSSIEDVKKAVQGYLDDLQVSDSLAVGLEVGATLQYTPPVKEEPVVDLERETYNKDRELLKQAMELVRDGVFTADDVRITGLQKKVRDGFNVAYLG